LLQHLHHELFSRLVAELALHLADRHSVQLFKPLFGADLLYALSDKGIELIRHVFFADVDRRVFGGLREHEFLVDHCLEDLVPQPRRRRIDVIVERVKIDLRGDVGEENAFSPDHRDDAVDDGRLACRTVRNTESSEADDCNESLFIHEFEDVSYLLAGMNP